MSKIFVKENMISGKRLFSISNSIFPDQQEKPVIVSSKSILLLSICLILLLVYLCGLTVFAFDSPKSRSVRFHSSRESKNGVKINKNVWTGRYEFTDVAGWRERGPGGAIPSVSYSVTVTERKGKLIAELEASGFQVNDDYACTAEAAGSRLNVYYQSGGAGFDKSNTLGFKKGQLLLSLIKTSSGKRTLYLYQPAGYRIFLFGAKKKKIYFSKS